MEENRKNIQKFYFTDEGKLVVESNKGVWVDGEQYVKMYGNFSCNAKTMGEIISKLKGIPVEVGMEETVRYSINNMVVELLDANEHTIQHYCVLGADPARIKEYEERLGEQHFSNMEIEKARTKVEKYQKEMREKDLLIVKLGDVISKHNLLPWYKRMFHKIRV